MTEQRCSTRLVGGRCIRTDEHDKTECYCVQPIYYSNDAWGGCNCDQCASDRAAVARVLSGANQNRTSELPK